MSILTILETFIVNVQVRTIIAVLRNCDFRHAGVKRGVYQDLKELSPYLYVSKSGTLDILNKNLLLCTIAKKFCRHNYGC